MKQAILSVTVNEQNSVEVRFQGEPQFQIPMLWALEFAKQYMVDTIKATQTYSVGWQKAAAEDQEREVTKSEAVGLYLDARKKLEERLQAIVRSDEKQTFTVNDSLLSNL